MFQYIKAIDVWMLGGMSFIFLSLLELAVIGHLVKDEGNVKKRPPVMCKKRVSFLVSRTIVLNNDL